MGVDISKVNVGDTIILTGVVTRKSDSSNVYLNFGMAVDYPYPFLGTIIRGNAQHVPKPWEPQVGELVTWGSGESKYKVISLNKTSICVESTISGGWIALRIRDLYNFHKVE